MISEDGRLSADRLRELLSYDKDTGVFVWRCHRGRNPVSGSIAGSCSGNGYRRILIDGRKYFCHRLAWLYVHGTWPLMDIDHINGIRSDNRIENLRDVSRSSNMRNLHRAYKNSRSGILGVSWDKRAKRWVAQKHCRLIGMFSTADEAKAAWDAA